MTSHVLVPLEDADLATEAPEYALSTFPDADITTLHVVHPFEADVDLEVGFSGQGDGDWFETATGRPRRCSSVHGTAPTNGA